MHAQIIRDAIRLSAAGPRTSLYRAGGGAVGASPPSHLLVCEGRSER
jgi:hypothetical protein